MRLVSDYLEFRMLTSCREINRRAVPETPDAVLRPTRISLPAGIESSERFSII